MRDVVLHEVEGDLPRTTPSDQARRNLRLPTNKSLKTWLLILPRTISIPVSAGRNRGILNGQFVDFLVWNMIRCSFHPWQRQHPSGEFAEFRNCGSGISRCDETSDGRTQSVLDGLNAGLPNALASNAAFRAQASQDQALNMLLSPDVKLAFDLSREAKFTRELYGKSCGGPKHLAGRRLTDAGVPLVTVNLSVGDLNGASGDNWDTHGNNFNRLKNDLLPPWDRAASALIQDLVDSGRIDDTLVVFLTEFGRTPKINGAAGRDHFPNCYSILLAGAGVQGGTVLGKSDRMASRPVEAACTPEDIPPQPSFTH